MKLVIIDYGAGNIKSIQFAFKRLGIDAVLSNNIDASHNLFFLTIILFLSYLLYSVHTAASL